MPYIQISPAEVLGFLTGVANVWLLARQNIWNWPIGIANNLLYLAVFLTSGLYGAAALQVVFAVLNSYGWYHWKYGAGSAQSGELRVTAIANPTWLILVAAVCATWGLLFYVLGRYTDSTVPAWDGITTAISLAATFGQARKWLESWLFWIAVDVIYIPLYLSKDLALTALLYLIFLCISVSGFVQWRRSLLRVACV